MTKPKKQSATGALNTLMNSLSTDEWSSALQTAKTQHDPHADQYGQDQRDANQKRHPSVRRCLLRIDRGEDTTPGIYLVRSRDISDGGIRILHGGPIDTDTICCVIIESTAGQSTAVGGTVAWCNPVKSTETPAYELGIRFYEPIDASPFADHIEEAEDAA